MATFADLFNRYPTLQINGITKNRTKQVPIGKRGGRVRAFLMTEHYEVYFRQLQALKKPIPENIFHSAVYGDEIMKNVIDIHLKQTKYIRMNILEMWTQYELRRQIELLHHEFVNRKTNRAQSGSDIHLMVAWWYDTEIGIESRIRKYNSRMNAPVLFSYYPERNLILKSRNQRSSRKRQLEIGEMEFQEEEIDENVEKREEEEKEKEKEDPYQDFPSIESIEEWLKEPEVEYIYLDDECILEEMIACGMV